MGFFLEFGLQSLNQEPHSPAMDMFVQNAGFKEIFRHKEKKLVCLIHRKCRNPVVQCRKQENIFRKSDPALEQGSIAARLNLHSEAKDGSLQPGPIKNPGPK